MSISQTESVAIIGGGFSGLATAVNLVRLSRRPLGITIVNQRRPIGRGIAFGTRRPEHLLNVAARNMSALADLPDHFLQWLRTRSEFDAVPEIELREKFVPRMIYGDYLRALMHQHLQAPAETVLARTTFRDAEAVDVVTHAGGADVVLGDGSRVSAGCVVLATGNEAPIGFPGGAQLRGNSAWAGNPWESWESRLPPEGGVVVLLGTGLSTVDAMMTLRTLSWQGEVHAVSRNGWLPHPHFRGIEYGDFPPPGVDLAALGLADLLKLIEHHCGRLRDMGANPAIVVDKMRPHTQRIWQTFSREERLQFVRRQAGRWNVLRHRIAPEIHAQLTTAQLTGQLKVHAAEIEGVEPEGNRLRVLLSGGKALVGDLVVNATGPSTRFTATPSLLLRNLLRRGLIAPDEMDMGVRVDPDHTAIASDGSRSDVILALGPILRGTLWESVAVPELRTQARRVAEAILAHTDSSPASPPPIMMEYMI